MPPKNKKNKSGGAQQNAAHNDHNGRGPIAKSRKQEESDEFERMLASLSKATEAAGKERVKQQGRDDKGRAGREEKHDVAAEKAKAVEKDFDAMLRRKQQSAQFQQLLQQLIMAQRPYLDAPNTDFHASTETGNPNFGVAVGEMQGWRVHMEDEHVIDVAFPDDPTGKEGLFCVFDGHSGKGCASKCSEIIPRLVRQHAKKGATGYSEIDFEKAYLEVDKILEQGLGDDSGCTAVTVHVTPEWITCASVGDSRAVLCRNGAAFPLAYDHKPDNADEKARIEAAGGSVSEKRVNGQLAMSRAMGDFTYKAQKDRKQTEQQVIALPDVIRTHREKNDTFVVLACDGIFDVLENSELIRDVCEKKMAGKSNADICEEICRECLAPSAEGGGHPARAEGTDNMTIMIVDLN